MTSLRKIVGDYCYYLDSRLGDGMSSQVYGGVNQKTNQRVAIKIVNKAEQMKLLEPKVVQTQIKHLEKLKGKPNILQLHTSIKTKHNIYIITDLGQKGTLEDQLKHKKKLSEEQALQYLEQIINGYKGIKEQKIVHRDIKPQNLIINQNGEIVISDFGLSIEDDSEKTMEQKCIGSPYYMAPEILSEELLKSVKYSEKSDIWAIGITYLEMLTGKRPWKARTQEDLIKEIMQFDIEKFLPNQLTKKSKLFLRRSLYLNPEFRMSSKELFQFVQSYSTSQFEETEENETEETKIVISQPLSEIKQRKIDLKEKQKMSKRFSMRVEEPEEKPSGNILSEGNKSNDGNSQLQTQKKCEEFRLISQEEKKPQQNNKIQARKRRTYQERVDFKLESIAEEPTKDTLLPQIKNDMILQLDSNQEKGTRSRRQSIQAPVVGSFLQNHDKKKKERKKSAELSSETDYLMFADKSQKSKKERKQSMQMMANIEELLLELNDPEKQEKLQTREPFKKKNVEIEGQILKELQGHINYFRLIFKIYKKVKELLKTNDSNIKSFRLQLLSLFNFQIEETRALKQFKPEYVEIFKKSNHFPELISLLDGYHKRYTNEIEKQNSSVELCGKKQFQGLLMYIMKILVKNVIRIEEDEEQLSKKRELVFILEEIVLFKQLWLSKSGQNWHKLNQRYNLTNHLDKTYPTKIHYQYWKTIKESMIEAIEK